MTPPPPAHAQHAQTPAQRALAQRALRLETRVINKPIYMPDGFYKGKTIRVVLDEVQKPDLGRKYGSRDPRPLDPPPVVQVRVMQVFHANTPDEFEVEMDAVDALSPGLICHVSLYPYNPEYEENPDAFLDVPIPPAALLPATDGRSKKASSSSAPALLATASQYPPALPTRPRVPPPENAALHDMLAGQHTVCPHVVADGGPRQVLYFVFPELLVRQTGHFVLLYRAMDLPHEGGAGEGRRPLLAETFGGVFAVYPSKLHPPLRPSTELSNHLSRHGIKLHSRVKVRSGRGTAKDESADEDEEDEAEPLVVRKRRYSPVHAAAVSSARLETSHVRGEWPATRGEGGSPPEKRRRTESRSRSGSIQ